MTITRQQIMAAVAAGNATLAEIAEHCKCREQDVRKPCSNAKTGGLLESYLDDVTGTLAYRLTAAGKKWRATPEAEPGAADTPAGASDKAAPAPTGKADFARDPELQYLAPEDYKLPPVDPGLLASANRMLCERLEGVAHALRGSGMEGSAEIDGSADLQMHTAALTGAYQMQLRTIAEQAETVAAKIAVIDSQRAELQNATALADKLQRLLDTKTHECEALRNDLHVTMAPVENVASADTRDDADLETVSLKDLIDAVSTFIDEDQSLTVFPTSGCTVNAFGRQFVCSSGEAGNTLAAAAMLAMREAA